MLKIKPGSPYSTHGSVGRKDKAPHAGAGAEVPHDKTAEVVLSDMAVVLATMLSIALAINLALLALHIG